MHSPAEPSERILGPGVSGQLRPLIFVVEDEEDIARLIAHSLQAAGFDVQSFVSGASVLSEAMREVPALFLLDVMLPGTDGFELCRHIRQTPALSATPIIFLTAKTSEADRVKGLELGGDDYVTKPFSPRELIARIRTVLRGIGHTATGVEVLRLGDLEIDDCSGGRTKRPHDSPRIPLARIFGGASRPGVDPRPVARCGMEGDPLRHTPLDRRLHPAAPREN